jgi:type II secretory pathway pseudopilin PulG
MPRWSDLPDATAERDEAGFTLLEFIAAFTIFSIFLAVTMAALSFAMRADNAIEFTNAAMSLAEAKIASAGSEFPLRPGSTQSVRSNELAWRASISPYGRTEREASVQVEAYWVEVTVSSPKNGRALSLATLKIVPASGAPESNR